jgi:nitroreductase
VFFWVCLPYKGEWRYVHTAHKIMLLDVGHICQNLYLAVEAIGGGCCAIGGYFQDRADAFLGVDGRDEYSVYCASVGRIQQG